MTRLKLTALLFALSTLLLPSFSFAKTQRVRGAAGVDRRVLAARVRAEFLHAWRGYERYAWGHDELRPLSKERCLTTNSRVRPASSRRPMRMSVSSASTCVM